MARTREIRRTLGTAVLVAAYLSACACASDDPNRPLTEKEGAALVKRVRKEQASPNDLTIQEKKWLKGYLAR